MCLACGYYNGRQIIDMKAEKESRAARIKSKKERIRNELNRAEAAPASEVPDVADETHAAEPVEGKQVASEEAKHAAQKENTGKKQK